MITSAFWGVAAIHIVFLGLLLRAFYALILLYIKTFKNTNILTVFLKILTDALAVKPHARRFFAVFRQKIL